MWRVAASSAWAPLIRPYVGYRVAYAVETCAPQDGSSRKGSSNVWDALCRYGSGKCSLNIGMILSASRQEPIGGSGAGRQRYKSSLACGVSFGPLRMSGYGSDRRLEQFTSSKHGTHDHGKLARDRNGGSLEADPFPELQPLGPQRAVCHGARQNHGCRFIQKPAQMVVAAPGYMPIVIDFTRLIAHGG